MSEHVWTQENLGAYLAGGLDPAEGERLDKHVGECTTCAADVAKGWSLSRKLSELFADAKPAPALEDDNIRALPEGVPQRHGWRPMAPLTHKAKIILAAAATILLAFIGAGAISMMEEESLRVPGTAVAANFFREDLPPQTNGERKESPTGELHYRSYWQQEYTRTYDDVGKSKESSDKAAEAGSKAGSKLKADPTKDKDGKSVPHFDNRPLDAAELAKKLHDDSLSLILKNQQIPDGGKTVLSITGTRYRSPFPKVVNIPPALPPGPSVPATVPVSPPAVQPGYYKTPLGSGDTKEKPSEGLEKSLKELDKFSEKAPAGKKDAKPADIVWKYTSNGSLPALGGSYFKPGGDGLITGEDKDKDGKGGKGEGSAGKPGKEGDNSKGDGKKDPEDSKKPGSSRASGQGNQAGQKEPPRETGLPGQKDPKAAPDLTPRKIIIRTGELEFEIDSFDNSVTTIMQLVTASKGGFIATINSDKLANGKVRGSVVVRMPPEQLDKFILDLRKELAKVGELKNQHLGSTDVTKQYTDLESRLRAARTMEERLISIIKSGKGEIKDLLQAEKELGVWRTKIEEMEGEIRYYNNLASLSTLTIKLYEKEIRTAAMVTENERVQAGIEVEDVEKAYQDALKAINDAKGRVSKSELKQHAAGQFNAILHFEVSPESAGPTRDRLRQLGNMVRLQIDRIQATENGNVVPRDAKIKRGDTHFLVSIYNLANVAPRETIILRLAITDVPATYQKLRELVAKAKGSVVNAQLNEQDRQNINAQLDFHVSRLGQGDVQAALVGAGETLAKEVSRVPESENVTDSKVLYRVSLIDADAIQPRETVTTKIAALEVPAAYQKLRETLGKLKARVINAQLNEKDRRNITGQLDFAFKRSDEGAVLMTLAAAGETLSRQVARLPESPTVTDAKVLVRLELIPTDSLPPRETVTLKIAAVDVPAAYQKLRDALDKVKARISNAQLNEQDRRNISAQLDFTFKRSDEAAVQEALTAAGESLSRQVTRPPESATAIDAKVLVRLELLHTEALPPRETVTLKIAAVDVPAVYQKLRDAIGKAKGRVQTAALNELDRRNVSAKITFEVPRSEGPATVQGVLDQAGEVLLRQVARRQEAATVTDSRVGFDVDLSSAATIPPRETTILGIEVADVRTALTLITAEAKEVEGRLINPPQETQTRDGKVSGQVVMDVPLAAASGLIQKIKATGRVLAHDPSQDPKAPEGKLALARIIVVVSSGDVLVPSDKGLWSQVRQGLAFSLRGLSISASALIVGVLFVLPWVLLVYAVVWLVRRMWRSPATTASNPPPAT
ncbi:MAG: DUF4349 domain-containing protein [Planctomycetes bacterium]|nr:DUF4349 domain-containing protein [Planctomycetota bacterium]